MPVDNRWAYRPLYPGDDVTVVFPDTTPDLVGTYRGHWGTPDQIVITTPQGEDDPTLQVVHYVDNYNYVNHDVVTGLGVGIEQQVEEGDNVTIHLKIAPPLNFTGNVLQTNKSSGVIKLDVAGDELVFKDWIYLEIN